MATIAAPSVSVLAADAPVPVLRVADGDTFRVSIAGKSETVRIIGIDTPETVDPRKEVQCYGKEASDRLKELLAGAEVTLARNPAEDRDKYRRMLRYVELRGEDIGARMIREGYAFSYKAYPHPRLEAYNALEKAARAEKRGLWTACPASSAAVSSASASPPSACFIKGNISGNGTKLYHFPGCGSYITTKITLSAGERWFCSEAQARAAGWRKAGNCR